MGQWKHTLESFIYNPLANHSMVKRGKLLVEGNIQSVGYRAFVKQIALGLGIRGKVKNLNDGKVEINFEAPDNDTYENFFREINRQSPKKGALFTIGVTQITPIEVKEVDSFSYQGMFSIDYGMELKPFERETLERQEIGILVLSDFDSKTQESFGVMEQKYGAISKSLEELKTGLLSELSEAIKIFAGKHE